LLKLVILGVEEGPMRITLEAKVEIVARVAVVSESTDALKTPKSAKFGIRYIRDAMCA
jgi:hypothetical protein